LEHPNDLAGPWAYGNALRKSLDKQKLLKFDPDMQREHAKYFTMSDQVCIFGEGPSIGKLPDEILLGDLNRFGVGYLPYTKISYDIMLHEPIACTNLYNDFTGSGIDRNKLLNNRNSAAMDGILPIAMVDNKPNVVVLNPEFVRDTNGYFSVYHEDMYALPLYFINERSRVDALEDLKKYFLSNYAYSTVLNYRCSIVRMISLAFILRYPTIMFTGLDPSLPQYWYTDCSSIERLCNTSKPHILQFQKIASQLSVFRKEWTCFVSPEGVKEGGYCDFDKLDPFDFTCAFFLVIKALLRKNSSIGYQPRLQYYGDDAHVLNLIRQTRLDQHIEHISLK